MNWGDLLDSVATDLARTALPGCGTGPPSPERDGPAQPETLLAALTAAAPRRLRQQIRRQLAGDQPSTDDIEPVIYHNEMPPQLLAGGIIDVAAQAVAAHPAQSGPRGAPGEPPMPKVVGAVAVSALSTIRLGPAAGDAVLPAVRLRLERFASPQWAQALDSLTRRTGELSGLLWSAGGSRRHIWPNVALDDRILAEAVAGAVVGGAASASGVPPQEWLFPFHVFCKLGASAAEDALAAIEGWLRVTFLPGPHTPERRNELAALVAGEAVTLHDGCGCKDSTDPPAVGFTRRGTTCRQADHDLRHWQPGEPKPGGSGASRYAGTLWGWLRRWLGGPGAGLAAEGTGGRRRLRPNDVAGSVLARKWLCFDHGAGGPVLFYDRVLPEFCLSCGSKPTITSVRGQAGHARIQRACCGQPRLAYRSEFSVRDGRRLLKPKLGIVLTSGRIAEGTSGYMSTAQRGPLWVCGVSGRYSLSGAFCPDPGCGSSPREHHGPLKPAWVLLPLGGAWDDLTATAKPVEVPVSAAGRPELSESDLAFLRGEIIRLRLGDEAKLATAEDLWAVARNWSLNEMSRFQAGAGVRGLELLLRCKEIATGSPAGGADDDG